MAIAISAFAERDRQGIERVRRAACSVDGPRNRSLALGIPAIKQDRGLSAGFESREDPAKGQRV